MNPDERKCGNCWCWRAPHPEYKDGEEYGICALRPSTADDPPLEPETWRCPEHRNAEEQAAMWEARAASIRAWQAAAVACAEAKARETEQFAVIRGMAARCEEAMAGGQGSERAAIVAWLRELNVAVLGDPSIVVDDLATRIERGEHRQIAQVQP